MNWERHAGNQLGYTTMPAILPSAMPMSM